MQGSNRIINSNAEPTKDNEISDSTLDLNRKKTINTCDGRDQPDK